MKKIKLFFINILTTILDLIIDLFDVLRELSFKLFNYFIDIETKLRKELGGKYDFWPKNSSNTTITK